MENGADIFETCEGEELTKLVKIYIFFKCNFETQPLYEIVFRKQI